MPDLLLVGGLCGRPVVCLLEQDLLHLAVLQVVQLPHRVLGAQDQVDQHRLRTLPLDKGMLWTTRGRQ